MPKLKEQNNDHLNGDAKTVADLIKQYIVNKEPEAWASFENVFRDGEEWTEDDGREYGEGSVLVVIHEGDDLGKYFSFDHCYERVANLSNGFTSHAEDYHPVENMAAFLRSKGFELENATRWCSAIYERQSKGDE
jgi:hypothetical protein